MSSDEYDKVELPALNLLQSIGWLYVDGSALSSEESEERKSFKDVVLEKRLSRSIKVITERFCKIDVLFCVLAVHTCPDRILPPPPPNACIIHKGVGVVGPFQTAKISLN